MKQDYNFDVDKIKSLSNEEKISRKKDLNTFLKTGFPNKQNEDWKFTDFNAILNKNFDKITNNFEFDLKEKFKILENFDHNYILLTNGVLSKSDFNYEDEDKIIIKDLKNVNTVAPFTNNNLTLLNKALSSGGYSLEIFENYKFQKPLIIYNYFSENFIVKETFSNWNEYLVPIGNNYDSDNIEFNKIYDPLCGSYKENYTSKRLREGGTFEFSYPLHE